MIRFIDITTGNVYNGDLPYVHWFDGKQSIALNYDKQFIVLSDEPELHITLDSEVFYLVDPEKINSESEKTFFDKTYLDLEEIKTNELILQPACAVSSDFYAYSFNIIACGAYVGEITEDLYINNNKFAVGADFVDENEALSVNLKNFGMELSNEVQRAIYEKRIDEQKTDFILLNRKFKELLNEYINVIANKGSYKSLINSLKWFEYGDIVQLYEYWKHPEPNKEYLSKRDITQFITTKTENLLYSMQKTAYIGISAALDKVVKTDDGTQYENYIDESGEDPKLLNEPNPLLENVAMLWSKNEMQLKMVLLGNFFATYFMPIHLDLIHSTIENIVYAQTIKMHYGACFERVDVLDNIRTFDCKLNEIYHLKNIETFTNLNTPFGFVNKQLTDEDEGLFILGVEEKFSMLGVDPEEANKGYNLQHFKGIGVLIPFDCTLCEFDKSATLTDGEIHVYRYENYIEGGLTKRKVIHKVSRVTNNVPHIPTDGRLEMHFNLLIQEIGEYKVQLAFRSSDGVLYTRVFDFTVDGEITPTLTMYRLVPKYPNPEVITTKALHWMQEEGDEDTDVIQIGSVADYVMNPVQQFKVSVDSELNPSNEVDLDPYLLYMQFISATTEVSNTVHTNQVIITKFSEPNAQGEYTFRLKHLGRSLVIKYNPTTKLINDSADVCRNFIWIVIDKYGKIENDPYYSPSPDPNILATFGGSTYKYIIGISKNPNDENYSPYELEQNQSNIVGRWSRFMFIPYFYKLEKIGETSYFERVSQNKTQEEIFADRNAEDTYTIDKTDVVCFLPDVKCIKRPSDFMWKFVCKTTEHSIEPITYRNVNGTNEFPTILQPLFGRYDFRILPEIGYYDVVMNYKMDSAQSKNETKTISSQFIVSRDRVDRSIKPTDTNVA